LRPQTAATNEPLADSWQAVVNRGHTQECKICIRGPLLPSWIRRTMRSRSRQAHDQARSSSGRSIASDARCKRGRPRPDPYSSTSRCANQTRVAGHCCMYHLCIAAIFAKSRVFL
jgi:hypothetical protein